MRAKRKQSGFTLTEMAVVIAVMALLLGIALPAVRMVVSSFESGEGANSMISSALAYARALAAREGHYVGVRFQKAYNPDAIDPLDPLTARQYMIFVIHDSNIMAHGFRAIRGTKPVKLPDSIGVMDLTIVPGANRNPSNPVNPLPREFPLDDPGLTPAAADDLLNERHELFDTTTFSIVFTPTGKLVVFGVRVRNRDGERDTSGGVSADDVFNKAAEVNVGIGMFYQDDYFGIGGGLDVGLGPEPSRQRFLIYDRIEFKKAYQLGRAWSGYLYRLAPDAIYINPYTGRMILKD